MNEKLNVLTTYNGSRFKDSMFTMFLIVYGFGIGLTLVIRLFTNLSFTFQALPVSLILLMPFIFFLQFVPAYVYSVDYYRKAKYYMIPMKEVFTYYLKEIFALKNILMMLGWDLYYIVFYYSYGMNISKETIILLLGTLLILPTISFLSFLFTTYMGRYKGLLQIVMFFGIIYGSLMILTVTYYLGSFLVLIALLAVDIVFYFILDKSWEKIESRMEV